MTWTLERWRAAGQRHAHRGHPVFYREEAREPGSDTALLLIHGFPTASWDWHRVWDALAGRFARVVAPDLIGFGFSAKPVDYVYSIFDQADLIEELLAHLGVTQAHILAHDYGDTVAQELIARHNERHATPNATPTAGLRILSCVLLNGGLFPEVHRARPIQKLLLTPLGPLLSRLMNRRSFGRSFSAIFGAGTRPTARDLDEFWSLVAHGGGQRVTHKLIRYMPERLLNRTRWVGALWATSVPLRVIDGPADPVSGAHMVARYRELIPHPDTVELPGIGHYPQCEDPAGTLRHFFEFHDRLGR